MAEGVREQGRVVDGASRRLASWFSWVVCALSLALTALSYILIDLISNLDAPIFFYWLEPTVVAVGYSVIGAIIASRIPNHPTVGRVTALAGVFGVPPSYLPDRGKGPSVLDEVALEALADERSAAILKESVTLSEREKEIVLGIVRQFSDELGPGER